MHHCSHCEQEFSTDLYPSHVKACIQRIRETRSPAEASARYFASIYKRSRFDRKTPDLLIKRYDSN